MSNSLQKDDFILPGNIGTMSDSYGNKREITQVEKRQGYTIITIGALVQSYLDNKSNTEDADFEVIQPENKKLCQGD